MGLQQRDWSRRENPDCSSDSESSCQGKQEKGASFPASKLLQPLLQNGPFVQPVGCPRHLRGRQASFAAFWSGDNTTQYSHLDCPSGSRLGIIQYGLSIKRQCLATVISVAALPKHKAERSGSLKSACTLSYPSNLPRHEFNLKLEKMLGKCYDGFAEFFEPLVHLLISLMLCSTHNFTHLF